jgi:Asp-tRNA(Asn)/Glu-tRNA(Gln) amidotransferase A subunit family amidase
LLLVGCNFAQLEESDMDELAFASATRLAVDVRDRRVGCLELLEHYLARAERHKTALNAVVALQIEGARYGVLWARTGTRWRGSSSRMRRRLDDSTGRADHSSLWRGIVRRLS